MSTRTKWMWTILGLFIVLVLGAAAFWAGRWFGYGGMMGGYDGRDRDYYHMMPYTFGFRSPLGWLGMGLGMLLLWGLPLGILALAVLGVVSLIRGSGGRKLESSAAAATTATPPGETVATPATTVLRECASCGKPAQADWTTCPYCGTPLG